MEKGQFEFKPGVLYKLTYARVCRRDTIPKVVIGNFKEETKWNIEFSHTMRLDGYVEAGVTAFEWQDIRRVDPVSEYELEMWKRNTVDFMTKIIQRYGHDVCMEDVREVVRYER